MIPNFILVGIEGLYQCFNMVQGPVSYFAITDTICIQLTLFGFTYIVWRKQDAIFRVVRRIQNHHSAMLLDRPTQSEKSFIATNKRGMSIKTKVYIYLTTRLEAFFYKTKWPILWFFRNESYKPSAFCTSCKWAYTCRNTRTQEQKNILNSTIGKQSSLIRTLRNQKVSLVTVLQKHKISIPSSSSFEDRGMD